MEGSPVTAGEQAANSAQIAKGRIEAPGVIREILELPVRIISLPILQAGL